MFENKSKTKEQINIKKCLNALASVSAEQPREHTLFLEMRLEIC
jgi:hypothetical protein